MVAGGVFHEDDTGVELDPDTGVELDAAGLEESTESEMEDSTETDSEDEDLPIYTPPETRTLPQRTTRGRRLANLNDAQDEFWTHETWEEEENDDEWTTEDEAHYKDKFDSDFMSSSEDDEIPDVKQVEDELNEDKRRKKTFDYKKIVERRKKRQENSKKKIWSVFEIEKRFRENPREFKKGKLMFQADLIRAAKQTEEINKQILIKLSDEIESRKLRQSQHQEPVSRLTGDIESWVSWNSERKIDYEEARKSEEQRAREAAEPPFERQLLFFFNITNPEQSRISHMYTCLTHPEPPPKRACTIFPDRVAKYQDPVTQCWYSDAQAFRILRERSLRADLEKVQSLLSNARADG